MDLVCLGFMPTIVLRRRQQILNNYISELCWGSGRSEFQIAMAISHEPSGCFRHMTRTLPVSVIGSGAPSTNNFLLQACHTEIRIQYH